MPKRPLTELEHRNTRVLEKAALSFCLMFTTATGLEKSLFDATIEIQDFLSEHKIHDFKSQQVGVEHKLDLPAYLGHPDRAQKRMSLYRPATKNGVFKRIWFSDLGNHIGPDQVLAIIALPKEFAEDRVVWGINISNSELAASGSKIPSIFQIGEELSSDDSSEPSVDIQDNKGDPRNLHRNSHVERILSWHPHDTGGVAMPFIKRAGFDEDTNVHTPVVDKLDKLAKFIPENPGSVNLVFLVGGPGNGKSHATEQFLRSLDDATKSHGQLIDAVTRKIAQGDVPPWQVKIESEDVPNSTKFAQSVGSIWLIQDASAVDRPGSDPAEDLTNLLANVMIDAAKTNGVLFCCANRGVLSDAVKIVRKGDLNNQVLSTLSAIQENTSISGKRLRGESVESWPLNQSDTDSIAGTYAWPMDLESICETAEGKLEGSAVDKILDTLSAPEKWDNNGPCTGCPAINLCPFLQNAKDLRKDRRRSHLVDFLRHSELLSGQRWSFRTMYALLAEITVGHWNDFGSASTPCEWVQSQTKILDEDPECENAGGKAAWNLLRHRFQHALFSPDQDVSELKSIISSSTIKTVENAKPTNRGTDSEVLGFIRRVIAPRMDPAVIGYTDDYKALGEIEDEYSLGIEIGNKSWVKDNLHRIVFQVIEREEATLANTGHAEDGWRERLALRRFATRIAKRGDGFKSNSPVPKTLRLYRNSIRNSLDLSKLRRPLDELLGNSDAASGRHFNLTSTFGQPTGTVGGPIGLHIDRAGMKPEPAPEGDETTPRHDMPMLVRDNGNAEVLTFDLYESLIALADGQSVATLPTSVRAATAKLAGMAASNAVRDKVELAYSNYVAVKNGSHIWELRFDSESSQLKVASWD